MQSNFNGVHNKKSICTGNIYNNWRGNSALIYWFLGIFAAGRVRGYGLNGSFGHVRMICN